MNGERIPAKRHRLEDVEIYEVTGDELDRIEQEAATIGTDLQFALVLLPVALSLTAALFLTTIPSIRVYVTFLVIMIIAYVFGAWFFIRWSRERGTFTRLLGKIRQRRVGPVGEEGKERTPAQLAELPSSEPPVPQEQEGEPK
jgi:uncharacterized membrane protein YraQ (UPF0718 family)